MVTAKEEMAFLRREAKPTLAALESVAEGAPKELQPLFATLRENLFAQGFTVAELKRELGITGKELLVRFHHVTGITPARYLQQARLETAARLLRNTPLSTEAVAWLVGYSDARALRRAFKKWSGYGPDGYAKMTAVAASIDRLAAAFTAATGIKMKARPAPAGSDVYLGWTVEVGKQFLARSYEIGALERLRSFAYRIARLASASGPHDVGLRFEDDVLLMRVESAASDELTGEQYRLVASIDEGYREMFGDGSAG